MSQGLNSFLLLTTLYKEPN